MASSYKSKKTRDSPHRSNSYHSCVTQFTSAIVVSATSNVRRSIAATSIRSVLDAMLVLVKVVQGSVAIWTGCLKGWTEGIVPA